MKKKVHPTSKVKQMKEERRFQPWNVTNNFDLGV